MQWGHPKEHWLLKNPTHMPRIPQLLKAYPDAKIILPHRDPIASSDSVTNVGGTIFSWRTDDIYGSKSTGREWAALDGRIKMWDDVINWIEDGTLREGNYANSVYTQFMEAPEDAIREIYSSLRLELTPEATDRMLTFLKSRHGQSHGNSSKYKKSQTDDPVIQAERANYARYQSYFNVPNEI